MHRRPVRRAIHLWRSPWPIRRNSSTPKSTNGSPLDGTTGTIGITDYAQNSLGDIVFVELPKVGTELIAGKTFGTVESVKAVSDLYAPGLRHRHRHQRGAGHLAREGQQPTPTPPGW